MFTVIFGRPGCPYCVRAKELAEKLTNERDDFNYRYTSAAARISKPGRRKISACLPERLHSSVECLRLASSQTQINKKHSAPSAHQKTALKSHASSCQNDR